MNLPLLPLPSFSFSRDGELLEPGSPDLQLHSFLAEMSDHLLGGDPGVSLLEVPALVSEVVPLCLKGIHKAMTAYHAYQRRGHQGCGGAFDSNLCQNWTKYAKGNDHAAFTMAKTRGFNAKEEQYNDPVQLCNFDFILTFLCPTDPDSVPLPCGNAFPSDTECCELRTATLDRLKRKLPAVLKVAKYARPGMENLNLLRDFPQLANWTGDGAKREKHDNISSVFQ